MVSLSRTFPEANIANVYTHELFEALRREIVYDPDYGLSEDPSFYEKLKKDAIVEFLVRYRAQLVAGNDEEWDVEAEEDSKEDRAVAKIIKSLLKKCKRFQSSRFNLAMAFLKGNTWASIEGIRKKVSIPGYGRSRWWMVNRLQDIDKRRFEMRRKESTKKWIWTLAVGLDQGGPVWSEINYREYIQHRYHDTESSLGHGNGLSAALYFCQWFKAEALRNGMQFINRWSQGLIVYTIDALRSAAVGNTADVRGESALALIDKIRAGQNIVVDKTDQVDVKDAPKGGWDTALQAIEYMDKQMDRLILASSLNTGGGSSDTGSYSRAETEDTAMGRLIGFDRELLAETLTDHLIKPIWDNNRPLFNQLGLGKANMPRFVLRTQQDIPIKDRIEIIKMVFEMVPALKRQVGVKDLAKIAGIPLVMDEDETETLGSLAEKYPDDDPNKQQEQQAQELAEKPKDKPKPKGENTDGQPRPKGNDKGNNSPNTDRAQQADRVRAT